MNRAIKLTKPFGGHKKGWTSVMGSIRAAQLVSVDKVAVYTDKLGETDKLLTVERKKELEAKKVEELTASLEAKYLSEVEAEFKEMLETEDGEAFKLTLKKRMLATLTEELKEDGK